MTARPTSIRVKPGSALERELAAAKARGQGVNDYLHEIAVTAERQRRSKAYREAIADGR